MKINALSSSLCSAIDYITKYHNIYHIHSMIELYNLQRSNLNYSLSISRLDLFYHNTYGRIQLYSHVRMFYITTIKTIITNIYIRITKYWTIFIITINCPIAFILLQISSGFYSMRILQSKDKRFVIIFIFIY